MPNKTFPAVVSFDKSSNRSEAATDLATASSEEADYARHIAEAVDVQEIDTNLYMSKELWLPPGARGAFGGQIVAQALRAAFNTVPEEFHVHSLHSYFILPGNVEYPVVYQVQRLRDGRSFATRFITATQRGKAIFVSSFSFAKPDSTSITLEHQSTMPDVPGPESLSSEYERLQKVLEHHDLPPKYREHIESRMEESAPIDYRNVHNPSPQEAFTGKIEAKDLQHRWFKTRGALSDDPRLHACIVAYASDSAFIGTAALANGLAPRSIGMMASLDHSMWFHAPARADEWLLYEMQSPRTSEGRGVAFGRLYRQDGTLVATTAQEGIVRLSRREQERRRKQREDHVATAPSKL
ncbi:HotDog domain-containing protein [Zychaea mexicana]|uniref:HotDog domain-containing protein n=1 Tax=Zychaea mexicana TaxID=64656 RepID=UPI0022FF0D27|nr:HotDog domain-containing protein [Zychaea mexicana]KAI9491530.1 HotDog domain-containing protein [Zychaea mexicana]